MARSPSPKGPRETPTLPGKRRIVLSERAFKRFSVGTTLLGVVLMAMGLNALIFEGRFFLFLALFLGGAAIASLSVFAEIRPPTPEELRSAERRTRRRGRRSRAPPMEAAPEPGRTPEPGPAEAPAFTVTLYTRKSCPACREARDILHRLRDTYGFEVWEQDVDADPALQAEWSDWVPVGMAGDEELFRLSLHEQTVTPKLARLSKRDR